MTRCPQVFRMWWMRPSNRGKFWYSWALTSRSRRSSCVKISFSEVVRVSRNPQRNWESSSKFGEKAGPKLTLEGI